MNVEKHRNLPIVLTMIASFILAFAYLYRQRIVAQRGVGQQSVVIPTLVARSREKAALPVPAVARSTAAPQEKSPVHAVPAAEAPPPSGIDDLPLPVAFNLGTRPIMINDDEGPPRRENQADGILLNSSDKRIAITVIEVNLPTMETTQAELVLQPNGMMHFGHDRGLKMLSGDQLTIRAAGYQDLTKTIP
jgi:hypothetical protein